MELRCSVCGVSISLAEARLSATERRFRCAECREDDAAPQQPSIVRGLAVISFAFEFLSLLALALHDHDGAAELARAATRWHR